MRGPFSLSLVVGNNCRSTRGKVGMALDGQDAKGRFAPGNKLSPGKGYGRRKDEFKALIESAAAELTNVGTDTEPVIVTKWEAICRKAVEMAMEGDSRARDWVADRLLGKVSDADTTAPPDVVSVDGLVFVEEQRPDAG